MPRSGRTSVSPVLRHIPTTNSLPLDDGHDSNTTRLSDVYGRRPFFILGFFGSAVGFIVIALYTEFSPALISPLIGRGLGGLFSASPPLAQVF